MQAIVSQYDIDDTVRTVGRGREVERALTLAKGCTKGRRPFSSSAMILSVMSRYRLHGQQRICGQGPGEAWGVSATGGRKPFSRLLHSSPASHLSLSLSLSGDPGLARSPLPDQMFQGRKMVAGGAGQAVEPAGAEAQCPGGELRRPAE